MLKFTGGDWKPDKPLDMEGMRHIFIKSGKEIIARVDGYRDGISCGKPGHTDFEETTNNAKLMAASKRLLVACKNQHEAIDRLFAMLIAKDEKFMPSKSGQPWDAINVGAQILTELGEL